MALDADDKIEIAQLIAEALKGYQPEASKGNSEAGNKASESDNTPVTMKEIKDLLAQATSGQQNEVKHMVFEQHKEQLFAQTPGFKKFFDEGTDWDDVPFQDKFDAITDLKAKADMLKKLQSNFMAANQPRAATPAGASPKSSEEQALDDKMKALTDQFHKGKIDHNQFSEDFWKHFDELLEA